MGATKGADPFNHNSEKKTRINETGLLHLENVVLPRPAFTVYQVMVKREDILRWEMTYVCVLLGE